MRAPNLLCLSPTTLGWLFVVLLAASLWMMTHLLDHLLPGPGMLLFQILLWAKLAVFVCLILEALWWYKQALGELTHVGPISSSYLPVEPESENCCL